MAEINTEELFKAILSDEGYISSILQHERQEPNVGWSGYTAVTMPTEPYDAFNVYWDNTDGGGMMVKAWSFTDEDDPYVITYQFPVNTMSEFMEEIAKDEISEEFLAIKGIVTDDRFEGHPTNSKLPMHPEIAYIGEGWVSYQDFLGISEADKLMNQLELKNKYRRKDFK